MPETPLTQLCVLVTTLAVAGCAARPGPAPEPSPDVRHGDQTIIEQNDSAPPAAEADPEPRSSEAQQPSAQPDVAQAAADLAAPPAGVYHPLAPGMTLYTLAKTYKVPVDTLMTANRIVDPTSIPAGAQIFVPGATQVLPVKPPVAAPVAPPGPRFGWPLRGRITSAFGASRKRAHHAGIDIDGEAGDPIHAAADGRVLRIADNARYGLLVVVGHDRGYATWYGHASDLLVAKGDTVSRGQVIALVGKSGNARGTHLHFEVRRNGRPVDPLPFLEASRISSRSRVR